MTRRLVLLAAAGAAAALLLFWFFVPKGEDVALAPIAGRARHDLAEACNQVAAAAARAERFTVEDVAPTRLDEAQAQGGVVALVSVLEARRGGLICRWNGADPATILPAD